MSMSAETAPEPTDTTTAYTVTPPYQVQHAGTVYGSGETLSAPAADARPWLLAGWVKPAESNDE